MGIFVGEVEAQWLPNGRDMELLGTVSYQDKSGKIWTAKKGSIVDGASIPRVFWTIVGSPFSAKYRRASVIHDVYYKTRTESRKQVDLMFYEAMRADGVGYLKAKTMYLAVRIGGPKWK